MAGIKQIRKQSVVSNDHIFNDRWLVKQLETTMVAPGRSPTAGVFYPSSLGNPCDRYLYLASGAATNNTFTAGKLLIELWGE